MEDWRGEGERETLKHEPGRWYIPATLALRRGMGSYAENGEDKGDLTALTKGGDT